MIKKKKNVERERGKVDVYLKYAKQNWVTILFIIISMIKRAMLDTFFGLVTFGFMLYICVSQEEYYKKKNVEYNIDSKWNGLASKFIVSVVLYMVVLVITLIHMIVYKESWGENIFFCSVLMKTYGKTLGLIFLQIFLDTLMKTKVGKWVSRKFF